MYSQGELGGKSGLVPSNFLDEIPKKRVEISQPERKSPKSSRVRINHRETSAIGNNPKHSDLSDYGSHSSQLDQVVSRQHLSSCFLISLGSVGNNEKGNSRHWSTTFFWSYNEEDFRVLKTMKH